MTPGKLVSGVWFHMVIVKVVNKPLPSAVEEIVHHPIYFPQKEIASQHIAAKQYQ